LIHELPGDLETLSQVIEISVNKADEKTALAADGLKNEKNMGCRDTHDEY